MTINYVYMIGAGYCGVGIDWYNRFNMDVTLYYH